uniref:Uncharacterized protein n=1 Tax=Amphimedon queenslandica TaxID=400682 RepID=A0A1X7V7B6_AMPQE
MKRPSVLNFSASKSKRPREVQAQAVQLTTSDSDSDLSEPEDSLDMEEVCNGDCSNSTEPISAIAETDVTKSHEVIKVHTPPGPPDTAQTDDNFPVQPKSCNGFLKCVMESQQRSINLMCIHSATKVLSDMLQMIMNVSAAPEADVGHEGPPPTPLLVAASADHGGPPPPPPPPVVAGGSPPAPFAGGHGCLPPALFAASAGHGCPPPPPPPPVVAGGGHGAPVAGGHGGLPPAPVAGGHGGLPPPPVAGVYGGPPPPPIPVPLLTAHPPPNPALGIAALQQQRLLILR